jgi:hypothetical protein
MQAKMLRRKTKRKIKKASKIVTKLVEATGIPMVYSTSAAWFAERLILASLCLIALSFATGVMFVLRWSEPIAESPLYDGISRKAALAQEGIAVYYQQIIDTASPVFANLVKDNHDPDADIAAIDLTARKAKLKAYLISKHSPFADDDKALDAFVSSKNMKLMLAISFVESTFGRSCYYYNCSGIGGTPPNLRKYNSYAEWIADFDQLLEQRYKGVPPEKFIGLYVQPGSPNWIYGVNQVLKEFKEQEIS